MKQRSAENQRIMASLGGFEQALRNVRNQWRASMANGHTKSTNCCNCTHFHLRDRFATYSAIIRNRGCYDRGRLGDYRSDDQFIRRRCTLIFYSSRTLGDTHYLICFRMGHPIANLIPILIPISHPSFHYPLVPCLLNEKKNAARMMLS